MQLDNNIDKLTSYSRSLIWMLQWDEVGILGIPVHYHEDGIVAI
jgi:hypothetical protein